MVDKKLYEDDLDFRDDLDLNSDLNLNNDYDDANLFDENDPMRDDETYSAAEEPVQVNNPKPQGFMDFLKSYGIAIAIFIVVGYMGLKYSMGVLNKNPTQDTTTAEATNNPPDQQPTDDKTALLPATNTGNSVNNQLASPTPGNGPSEPVIPGMPAAGNTANISAPMMLPGTAAPVLTNNAPAGSTVSQQQLNDLDAKIVAIGQSLENMNKIIADQKTASTTVDDLKNQVASLSAKLGTQTDVIELRDRIQKFTLQQEQLLMYVQGVGQSLGVLSDLVKKQQVIVASFVSSNIGEPVPKASGQPGLVIEAVISGRAWLKTVSGQAFSVTMGDKIPGYGTVTAIDAVKGELTTDTGMVLTQ